VQVISSMARRTGLVVGAGAAAVAAGWLAATAPLALAVLVAAALSLWLVLGPDLRFFAAVLMLRTLSDVRLLPDAASTVVNVGISALAVLLCVRLIATGARLQAYAVVVLGYLFFFTLRGLQVFGVDETLLNDTLRMLAVVAFAVAAGRLVQLYGPDRVSGAVIRAIAPAVLFSGITWILRVPAFYSETSGRGTGTFAHPVAAGGFFAVAVLLVFYSILVRRRTEHVLMLVAVAVAAVATVSLGTWVSILAGSAFLLALMPAGAFWKKRIVVLGVVSGLSMLLLVSSAIEERLTGLLSAEDYEVRAGPTNSFAWRLRNWGELLGLWEERPVLGWGYGATSVNLMPLGESPHSGPVRILVESGAVGLAVALGVLTFLVAAALRQRKEGDRAGSALRLAVLVVTVVNSLSSNTMGYFPMLMLVVAAWAIGAPRAPAPSPAKRAAWRRPGGLRAGAGRAGAAMRTV
jgi:O-antigen ligase